MSMSESISQNNAPLAAIPATSLVNDVPFKDIAQYFTAPINDAARELGIGITALKLVCRRNGLKRWPFRKVFLCSLLNYSL